MLYHRAVPVPNGDSITETSTDTIADASPAPPGGNNRDKKKDTGKGKKPTSRNYRDKPTTRPGDSPTVENAKPELTEKIDKFFKKTFPNESFNHKIQQISETLIKISLSKPGDVGGNSRAVYNKILDMGGNTVRFYLDTYSKDGSFWDRDVKLDLLKDIFK